MTPHGRLRKQGLTLMEVLLASTLGAVVILAMGQVDVTRVLLSRRTGGVAEVQAEAAFAIGSMAKSLLQADRVRVLNAACAAETVSGSCLQFRIPTPGTDLDTASNYTWRQYRFDSGSQEVRYFDTPPPSCSRTITFRGIGNLTVRYRDESGVPPGGEPILTREDNNVIELVAASVPDSQGRIITYTDQVTIRAGAYTANTNGLAPLGISDPPAPCS